jgi:hypothetical protein
MSDCAVLLKLLLNHVVVISFNAAPPSDGTVTQVLKAFLRAFRSFSKVFSFVVKSFTLTKPPKEPSLNIIFSLAKIQMFFIPEN